MLEHSAHGWPQLFEEIVIGVIRSFPRSGPVAIQDALERKFEGMPVAKHERVNQFAVETLCGGVHKDRRGHLVTIQNVMCAGGNILVDLNPARLGIDKNLVSGCWPIKFAFQQFAEFVL
jgi:hypothetical protein